MQAERLGAAVGDRRHTGERERGDRLVVGRAALEAGAVGGGGEDVLEHRHAAERARDLVRAHQTFAAALGDGRIGHVLAAKAHPPAGRRMSPDQHAEQRRLAGAVGADDADRLAGAEGKVHVLQHAQARRRLSSRLPPSAEADPDSPSAIVAQPLNGMSLADTGTFGSVALSVTT